MRAAALRGWWAVAGRPAARPMLAGLAVTLVGATVGLYPADALLVGAVTAVVVALSLTATVGEEYLWPEDRYEAVDGTRREIATLTWAFVGREGKVSEAAVRQLRAVARRRFARHGLALDETLQGDPTHAARAQELVGERAWRVLSAPGGWMPTQNEVAHCVRALEQIHPDPARTADGRQPQ